MDLKPFVNYFNKDRILLHQRKQLHNAKIELVKCNNNRCFKNYVFMFAKYMNNDIKIIWLDYWEK
jgi:hypothetical protein